jgi:hypothetical protein
MLVEDIDEAPAQKYYFLHHRLRLKLTQESVTFLSDIALLVRCVMTRWGDLTL